uniref:Zinc finger-like n=1 Tax=Oryza glaberrima TaxID=4538 RepID=A0A679BA54_ORYGL|nr:zinc finger-like [Oryza glaberrima]
MDNAMNLEHECMGGAKATSADPVKVSTTTIFPTISRGHTTKDFQVLLRVEAPPMADLKGHVPIDIVAVLDVSGSMGDPAMAASNFEKNKPPSRLDVLKEAIKFIIRKLDDGDRLSIVAFNDRPVKEYSTGLLDISGNGRRIAEKKVDWLEAQGGTALMPALEEAIRVLDSRSGDSRNRVGFIILLTDGDDTSGFRWSREAIHGAVGKYPVHTFGLGAAHNSEALLYIAQESRGTYSFVDDENMDKIAGALAVCLGGLKTVAAIDTRVSLKVAELSGARIERIDSGGYESHVACGGASGEVVVGVLYAGEVKNFIIHLHLPAASVSSLECGYCDAATVCDHHCRRRRHEQRLLEIGYSYRRAPDASAISIGGRGVFVQRPEEEVLLLSPMVLQHIVRFELLEIVAGFVESEIIILEKKTTTTTTEQLQRKWEEVRRAWQVLGVVELDGMEKEVDAIVSSLRRGLAYVSSWVSSHQMQRATAMGSPEKVAAGLMTPAMVSMVEEARRLPPPTAAKKKPGCDDDVQDMIGQRLELWSKVRREVPLMYEASASAEEEEEQQLVTAVFREASLEAIDRAMHRDVYLAVVHASNRKRCAGEEVADEAIIHRSDS